MKTATQINADPDTDPDPKPCLNQHFQALVTFFVDCAFENSNQLPANFANR
jgi:hypothetical protein